MADTKQSTRSLPIWGAIAGVLVAAFDTVLLRWLGLSFTWSSRDATLTMGAFMAVNYGLLGFLIAWMFEARRRERRSTRLLAESAEAIARIRGRLAETEKLAALGELSTAVAHEVRNPLGVIRSAAQSLGETETDDEGKRACAFIVAEIDRLSSVVSSLLALARPLTLERHAVSANEIFEHARLLAAETMRARNVALAVRVPPGLPPLEADADLLCQVVLGLVINAAEASPIGGEIVLDAGASESGVDLTVSDSGPGVPPELRERIFEPFFTTRSQGTGLGLAIARRIVEAHDGRITVAPGAGGRGARFSLRIPAAAPARKVA